MYALLFPLCFFAIYIDAFYWVNFLFFAWERPHLTFYFPTVAGLINSKKASALLHLAPNF